MPAYTTTMLSSVTRLGITWNFTAARPVWQYPNGDFGVQRPVTIASYTPAPKLGYDSTARNGAMINPLPGTGNYADSLKQGWSNETNLVNDASVDYDAALNYGLSLPYTVPVQAVLCNVATYDEVGFAWLPEKTHFRRLAFLTALDTVPEAGTLPPPYAGPTLKTVPTTWNENNFDYTKLRTNPIPSPLPGDWPVMANMITALNRRQLDLIPFASTGGSIKAEDWTEYPFHIGYGADISQIVFNAGILLNSAYTNAEKLPLLRLMVLMGLDTYGIYFNNGNWGSLGGHSVGRMPAVLIAAAVLNDANILASLNHNSGVWAESKNYFTVTNTHVVTQKQLVDYTDANPANGVIGTPARFMSYSVDQIGMDDFGLSPYDPASTTPQRNFSVNSGGDGVPVWYNKDGNVFGYRSINTGTTFGLCYLAQIMGLRSAINNEPMFRYISTIGVSDYLGGYGATFQLLWARDIVPPSPVVLNKPTGYYEPGFTVSASTPTLGAAIRWTNNGTTPVEGSTLYAEQLTINVTTTLKFVPFAVGLPPGNVTTLAVTMPSDGKPVPPRRIS